MGVSVAELAKSISAPIPYNVGGDHRSEDAGRFGELSGEVTPVSAKVRT